MGAAKDIPDILSNLPVIVEALPVAYDAIVIYNKSLKAANVSIPDSSNNAINDAKADLMKGMM
jgi:hypothetical protein